VFSRILVANRGEISLRVLRTCRELGIEAYLASSEADLDSLPARSFDRTVCVGPNRSDRSYLNQDAILATAVALGCDAIHPGYGFLAENDGFAERCAEAGVTFIGPSPEMLRLFGDKVSARNAAIGAGVPVAPGSPPVADIDEAREVAEGIGYPIMLKAARGGGGKGMRIVGDATELEEVFPLATAEALAAFGDASVYIERWIGQARHVEVQIVADRHGHVIHLGDRDCSVQRRNQKLVEEAPAPFIDPELQDRLRMSAVQLCEHVGYDSVGTVEYLLDSARGEFYFLEVNPRVQVEHGVTELVTGQDIVALQIAAAAGQELPVTQADVRFDGHALQCRINAEDPTRRFQPSPGRVTQWSPPEGPGIRIDSHCYEGYFMPPYYDSLLAKVMTTGADRAAAIAGMERSLDTLTVGGVRTTKELARWIISGEAFAGMRISTRWLDGELSDGSWQAEREA